MSGLELISEHKRSCFCTVQLLIIYIKLMPASCIFVFSVLMSCVLLQVTRRYLWLTRMMTVLIVTGTAGRIALSAGAGVRSGSLWPSHVRSQYCIVPHICSTGKVYSLIASRTANAKYSTCLSGLDPPPTYLELG